ncbi:retrovirus-related pol polyprotein from transposon TNT 1-94 [Tanacetum coccineum]
MLAPKCPTFNGRPTFAKTKVPQKAQNEIPDEMMNYESDKAEFSNMYDMLLQEWCLKMLLFLSAIFICFSLQRTASNVYSKGTLKQYFEIQDLKAQLQDKEHSIRVAHKTNVSRPQPRSNQMKDKVVPNTSHVKFKKTEVEEHPDFSNFLITQSRNGCNDSLNSRTSEYFEDVNARTNKPMYAIRSQSTICSRGQFCDADLEVAFRKSTCFVRDLQGNNLLTGNRGTDLYTISLQETTSSTPICLMAKASPTQAWLWHRRLSHLNFDYINLLSKKDVVIGLPKLKYVKDQLCSSCEVSKAKRSSFKSKTVPSSKGRLNLLHMDLCGPMRVASINGKKYILVIVDDYSRYTWTLFLRSKDETPEVLKDFLTMIQRNLQAPVISVRTDRGTEFLNKTLHAFFKEEGIEHQTSTPRTPEQNGVVERRNRTLVEADAARTMQSCENLDKLKKKGFMHFGGILRPQSKGYRVYNKRTRLIVESIHLRFDEIKEMSETSVAKDTSGLIPQRQKASWFALTVSIVEPKTIKEAMVDSAWIEAMQEELHQFNRLQVLELVDKPFGKNVIKLKWLWKNKKYEDQTVIRNKARLVAKGYAQEEGIDFE